MGFYGLIVKWLLIFNIASGRQDANWHNLGQNNSNSVSYVLEVDQMNLLSFCSWDKASV